MKRNLRSYFSVYKCVRVLLLLPFATIAKESVDKTMPISLNNPNIAFIQNVGQVISPDKQQRKDIDYKLDEADGTVFIGAGQLQYTWYQYESAIPVISKGDQAKGKISKTPAVKIYNLSVALLGSNPNAEIITADEQKYHENYYLPYCNGKTAHTYRKITYRNIYPNIDWVLYTDGKDAKGFKYDFIVHKGGKVSDIKVQYNGATSVKLSNGALVATNAISSITEQKPYTYDAVTKQQIESNYTLTGNVMGFNVADNNNEIVIDPKLNWGTYFGDAHVTVGMCTAADTFGNSYLCGYTGLANNVATPFTAFQSSYGGGNSDGFIVQFDVNCAANYRTYFGGDGNDQVFAATCDKTGNLYLTGITTSVSGFSFTTNPGSVQQPINGGQNISGSSLLDAFLAKFDKAGAGKWCTYIGGPGSELGYAVAVDDANNVYAGGNCSSTVGIYSGVAYQSTPSDGFLIKYSTLSGQRSWGTYISGNVTSIAADNYYSVYVGGGTLSYNNIGTNGTFQPAFGTGTRDGFIIKLRSNNGKGVWGTYYGGEVDNGILSLTCDSFLNIYAGGTTTSTTGIASTTGALFTSLPSASTSGFLAKLDSNGKRSWGSYYPGFVNSLTIGPDNKLYIGGATLSTTDIATAGAYQSTWAGPVGVPMTSPPGYDAYIAKFTVDGGRLWGTYYGGPSYEYNITASYGAGKVYVGGNTDSKAGIGTSNGWLSAVSDSVLGFLGQFQSDTSVFIKFPYIDSLLCAGGPLKLTYGVTTPFKTGNVFTAQISDATGSFATPVNIGSVTATSGGLMNCTIPVTVPQGVGYKIRIVSSLPKDTFYNYNVPIRVSSYHKPDAVAIAPVCESSSLQIFDANSPAPDGTSYYWTGPNSYTGFFSTVIITGVTVAASGKYYVETDNHTCKARDTIDVLVTPSPATPVITGDTSLCVGDTLTLDANSSTAGVSYQWLGPKFQAPVTKQFKLANADLSDVGVYKVGVIINGCASAYATKGVTVHSLPHPQGFNDPPVCSGDTVNFSATDTIPGVSYHWTGPNGFSSNSRDNVIYNATAINGGTYHLTTTSIYGCQGTTSISIVIKPLPSQIEASNNGPTCSGLDLQLIAKNTTPGANYTWFGPNNYTGQSENPIILQIPATQQGVYKVIVDLDGCTNEDTTFVTVYQSPDTPKLSSNSPLKTGSILRLNVQNPIAGGRYSWIGPNGFTSQFQNPIVNSVIPANAGIYTATVKVGICSSSDTITVKILDDSVKANPDPMVVFPSPNDGIFTIKGGTKTTQQVMIVVYASDGKEVYREFVEPDKFKIDHKVTLGGVANGIYRLKLVVDGKITFTSFVIKA